MIFITGASGGVGSVVLEYAVAQGLSVRAGSRDPTKSAEKSKIKTIEWVKFDFDDPLTFADSFRGVEKVFLYNGANSDKFVTEAKKAGVKLIVFMSSLFVNLETESFVGSVHESVEKNIKNAGIDWVFLRGCEYMKNEMRLIPMVKNGHVFTVYPKSKGLYVHERDIAEVAVTAFTRPELVGTAPVLTGWKYNTEDVVGVIEKRIGKIIPVTEISEEVASEEMKKFGLPERMFREVFAVKRRAMTEEIFKKSDDIEKILGKPPRTFEDWLEERVYYFL
ncbi:hypothetical protein HK098_004239 [Nowakowskiella sp. JEL0407]|nr:hypothetical protein HK098_004239 [Nowakowskiella sp. JEL0407]